MIPYDKIDEGMIPLIATMNKTNCITTIGCCIGHKKFEPSEVIFKVVDEQKWEPLMNNILLLNSHIMNANIDIYQWHRLNLEGHHIIDWILRLEVHPPISNLVDIQKVKFDVLNELVNTIEGGRASTLSPSI